MVIPGINLNKLKKELFKRIKKGKINIGKFFLLPRLKNGALNLAKIAGLPRLPNGKFDLSQILNIPRLASGKLSFKKIKISDVFDKLASIASFIPVAAPIIPFLKIASLFTIKRRRRKLL